MNEKELLNKFTKSMKKYANETAELLKAFDLANLGVDMLNQQEREIYNEVLNDYEFYASDEKCKGPRTENMRGQRITDEKWAFLLSDEDFDRLTKLAHPLFVARNITDDDGYYIVKWYSIRRKAKDELVSFILGNLLPKSMSNEFQKAQSSIVFQDKLIDIIRGCFA